MAGGRHDHPQDQHRLQDRGLRERLHGAVSEFFEIEQRGSTVAAEVRAGLVSFLTMSYILLVNPQILSQVRTAPLMLAPAPQANDRIGQSINQSFPAVHPPHDHQIGFSKSDVVVATAVGSGIASLTCGVFGNLPFGLAPGTGLSAYLSYGLVLSGILTRPQAMTVCFISGAWRGVRAWIVAPGLCVSWIVLCLAMWRKKLTPRHAAYTGIAMGACALLQFSTVIMRVIPRCVKLATVVSNASHLPAAA